jgi:leader peptidase (prepilin peptidase)/N-methyltransferase
MIEALLSPQILYPAVALLGLLLGSFANVIIYRLPKGESIAWPRSRCQTCKTPIPFYHNIPVMSWLLLRARCHHCRAKISWRYPLVELVMAGCFLAVTIKTGPCWTLIEYLILVFGLVTASFIDVDHMILPDVFTLSGIVIGLAGAAINPERDFLSSVYGVLMGGGFLWAVAYVYLAVRKEEGMGGGDIKLLAWIGAVLGWTAVPFVVLASSLVGSLVGLSLAVRKAQGLKSSLPFGPYLSVAALIYILGGDAIGRWYISLFLPSLMPPN